MMKKAVFLDRDGVINEDVGYVHRIEDFKFIPGVFKALKLLQKHNFLIIIVTNQSGIAKGLYKVEDFLKVNEWMLNKFKKRGIKISKVYFCKEYNPKRAKPSPSMLLEAAEEFNICLSDSWMIGDKDSDIIAGKLAGCKTIRILSPYPQKVKSDYIASNLLEAAKIILNSISLKQNEEH